MKGTLLNILLKTIFSTLTITPCCCFFMIMTKIKSCNVLTFIFPISLIHSNPNISQGNYHLISIYLYLCSSHAWLYWKMFLSVNPFCSFFCVCSLMSPFLVHFHDALLFVSCPYVLIQNNGIMETFEGSVMDYYSARFNLTWHAANQTDNLFMIWIKLDFGY